jgi:hypothetical protein
MEESLLEKGNKEGTEAPECTKARGDYIYIGNANGNDHTANLVYVDYTLIGTTRDFTLQTDLPYIKKYGDKTDLHNGPDKWVSLYVSEYRQPSQKMFMELTRMFYWGLFSQKGIFKNDVFYHGDIFLGPYRIGSFKHGQRSDLFEICALLFFGIYFFVLPYYLALLLFHVFPKKTNDTHDADVLITAFGIMFLLGALFGASQKDYPNYESENRKHKEEQKNKIQEQTLEFMQKHKLVQYNL